jgi:hypothetical protein
MLPLPDSDMYAVRTGHNEEISEEITVSLCEEKQCFKNQTQDTCKESISVWKNCLKCNDEKMFKGVLTMIAVAKTFEFVEMEICTYAR